MQQSWHIRSYAYVPHSSVSEIFFTCLWPDGELRSPASHRSLGLIEEEGNDDSSSRERPTFRPWLPRTRNPRSCPSGSLGRAGTGRTCIVCATVIC